MLKKYMAIMLIIVVLAMLAGCSNSQPAESPIQPEASAAPAEEVEQEIAEQPAPEQTQTLPENDMGLISASIGDIQELVTNESSFYLYIHGGELVPYDYEAIKQGVATLFKDYKFPADFYYVDESILTEDEYAAMQDVMGIDEVAVIDGDGRGVATYSGMHAFENGVLKNSRYDFVPGEDNANIPNNVINFIFESDLFTNDHGWELVTYEQLKENISSGERFLVYIGRDTCPFCLPFALSVESALDNCSLNLPIRYFYTQSYKTAINWEVEGAQEAWDSVKADIGFQFTPSLLVFDGGEQTLAYDGGIGSEYFDMDDAEKKAERDKVAVELEQWLVDNGLVDAVS